MVIVSRDKSCPRAPCSPGPPSFDDADIDAAMAAISVAAVPMSGYARPSSAPPLIEPSRKELMMHASKQSSLVSSRREFIKGATASGFLLAFYVPARAVNGAGSKLADDTKGKFAPNGFIRIDKTGMTTLVMPQVEMGQQHETEREG